MRIRKYCTIHFTFTFLCIYLTLLSKTTYSKFSLYMYLSVCVFPGNRTHNLCAANTMLYHWATGTLSKYTKYTKYHLNQCNLPLISVWSEGKTSLWRFIPKLNPQSGARRSYKNIQMKLYQRFPQIMNHSWSRHHAWHVGHVPEYPHDSEAAVYSHSCNLSCLKS